MLNSKLRSIISTGITKGPNFFKPYDRYGTAITGMSWLPLSVDRDENLDLFLLKFAPGAHSHPHEHVATEQFLVLEGSLTDCDGTTFKSGDFVRFEKKSKHYSYSNDGCLILVILRERNKPIKD